MCTDDSRLPDYLNEAVMRLLPRGKWRGTVVRYQCCVNANCLTWPRQIESIEAFSICDKPGIIRSHWYEFLGYGPGQFKSTDCNGNLLVDRGIACAFDDIADTGNRLKIYCDLPQDNGAVILVQGIDENGNWIITNGGEVNGENVTLSGSGPVSSVSKFMNGGLTGIQKPITKGPVRLYDWNPATGVQRPLAVYEPDETVPEYRRSMVPGLSLVGGCSDSVCELKQITVMAKLAFVPVRLDTDYLIIGNIPALKDMCQSIKKREDNLIKEAAAYEASAVVALEYELANFHGDGTSDPVSTINSTSLNGVTSLI